MLLGFFRQGRRNVVAVGKNTAFQQEAHLSGKAARAGLPPRPKPYPYKEKKYGLLQAFFDKTSQRFDENSKIVVVEGPVASGKTQFAKALAEELDMLYLPAATVDALYINSYGFDLRSLNDKLPKQARCFDVKDFLINPKDKLVASFQIKTLLVKYLQHVDAVCHLFNTGQGVVLERSVFGDHVFVEAMYKAGYVGKGAREHYYRLRKEAMPQILKPHLVIYLDVPVSKVQENIQKRSIQYEVKSKVLSPQYLADLEKNYKENYLNTISEHAELLVYDWTEGGDVEVVVEDIEQIDFDRFEKHDKKLHDWRFAKEWDMCGERIMYTSHANTFLNYFNIPALHVPELMISGQDHLDAENILKEAPGAKFNKGFNEDMGDKNILMKSLHESRSSFWL